MGVGNFWFQKFGIAIMLMLTSLSALAEETETSATAVTVTVDRAKVFRIEEAASTVIVGNPFIADVSMHDRYTVVVTGKAYGSTNLVILDDANEPIIDEIITVKAQDENTVSVFRNVARTTYSCSPGCEPTLRLGDNQAAFASAAEQSSTRSELAVKAAGAGN
ncbi:pilus assembly protein N-terminal domain-containing protein [Roseibium algae]|uniref:Pilus assembly protein N-terminal domain-containing protein n=1 Tax=Roseibium algae TaxID=3123038 RepID=A0ABU8TQV1_9HYPH